MTFGRFNSISIGHEFLFDAILEKWDTLTIIILEDVREIDNVISERKYTEFYDMCDSNWNKRMLSLENRFNAMSIFKVHHKSSNRINVVIFPRAEYFPLLFNIEFPKHIYDLVFSNDQSNKFDQLKIGYFEKIFNRKIHLVEPKIILHNQKIKSLVNKQEDLMLFYDKELLNYYKEIGVMEKLWDLKKK